MEKQEDTKEISKQGFIKQLMSTGQLQRLFVYIGSAVPALICVIFGILSLVGIIQPWKIGDGQSAIILGSALDYFLIAALIFSGVYGMYEFFHQRKIQKINERFPDFVRDLAESRRAGMTFTKAIMYSAKGNYGILTPEIKKIARQISWGSSVENALSSFSKRVNTKLINRTVSLIIEASKSGGNVADVLDAASKDAKEIRLIDSERRASMLSYVAVIYVGMGVFILIMIVLCKNLLPSMLGEGRAGIASAVGGSAGIQYIDVLSLFFYAALVQTAGMGIVTGVFEQGNVVSGVKHMFIMLLVTWIIFKFMIGGI
jgi:flagellar protein FlaJ